jgi:hypothetical protein
MPTLIAKGIAYFFVTVIVLMGPIMLTVSAVAALRQAAFIMSAASTEGTIVQLRLVKGHRGAFGYAPVFRFTPDGGETLMLQSDRGKNPAGFNIGERVKVYYEKGNPLHARIDTFYQLWMPQAVFGALGALLCVFPVQIYRRRRWRSAAP